MGFAVQHLLCRIINRSHLFTKSTGAEWIAFYQSVYIGELNKVRFNNGATVAQWVEQVVQ